MKLLLTLIPGDKNMKTFKPFFFLPFFRADELIQEMINKKFCNATVLTVAHRLNTVMSSDRVLVMEDGKVMEFDPPSVLLQKQKGYFRNLVKETGSEFLNSFKKTGKDTENPI